MSSAARSMEVVRRVDAMRRTVGQQRQAARTVGFVPTMGALHAGHLSLVAAARRECDVVVASVYVNPTQFSPSEDLARYPRPWERDRQLLQEAGCDWVFAPADGEMYPPGFDSHVDVGGVARPLEGEHRPTHFRGVATVVLKLLAAVPADRAYFGRKDYQQTLVVQRLVADFHLPTEIVVCPIVREEDGLAMSSRNAYLSADERRRATALYGALRLAQRLTTEGETSAAALRRRIIDHLTAAGVDAVDYVALVAEGTVEPVESVAGPTTIVLACRVGATRLIDNALVTPPADHRREARHVL